MSVKQSRAPSVITQDDSITEGIELPEQGSETGSHQTQMQMQVQQQESGRGLTSEHVDKAENGVAERQKQEIAVHKGAMAASGGDLQNKTVSGLSQSRSSGEQ
ncbi:hypothetical protein FBU59_006452, partial [Linderina macrospora]